MKYLRKYLSKVSLMLFMWAVMSTVSFAATVEVTEVAWMGTEESQFGEWIELHNTSSAAISLDGWKLYEGGGSTLLFSFSKTIPANGYLVLERTTPSTPDPLPAISDESGSFGGSGLANTGEHLVLKDTSGTIIDNLSFQSGWPAGDAETKQTMQKKEDAWITATPTPKSPTAGAATDDEIDEPAGETIPATTTENKEQVIWEPSITFSSPKQALVGVPVRIAATVTQKTGMTVVGNFFWNTGAGQVIEQRFLEPITVTYQYPGDYVITLAYARHANAPEPELVGQFSMTVTNPSFSIERGDSGTIFVKNMSTSSLDLYQWQLLYAGNRYVFPKYSIVKPSNRLAVPATLFGTVSFTSMPTLINPSGTPIGMPDSSATDTSGHTAQAARVVAVAKVEPVTAEKTLSSSGVFSPLLAAANTDTQTKSNQRTWLVIALGTLVVISVFLFLLLERFKAREE